MAEEILNSVPGDNNQEIDTTQDYLATIKQLKENTVSKETYLKLKEQNKQLLDSVVNGQTMEQQIPQKEPVDIYALRKKLLNRDSNMSNLEYVSNALELRKALMENGEIDPFVPNGVKIKPTDEDFQKAQKVAEVLQECVDYADGNSDVFTDELKRRMN